MLDTDGDGEIDYEEFSRWFGAGPPPPPMTPEMAFRAQMQQEAGARSPDRQADHLNAIQVRTSCTCALCNLTEIALCGDGRSTDGGGETLPRANDETED